MAYYSKINHSLLFTLALFTLKLAHAEAVKIEYLVPMGFSAAEENNSLQLLGVLDSKTLPSPITFSEEKQQLQFNQQNYRHNNISEESIILLGKILSQIPYLQCKTGCDYTLSGHRVALDKVNNTLTITNNNNRYLMPTTTWGLVSNQSLDLRMTAAHYRAMSVRGQSYIGLPWQSYGFASWFYNATQSQNTLQSQSTYQPVNRPQYQRLTQKGIGSWYLQKNFSALYLRTGRQNNLDNNAGSVHTLINPALDQFVTLGSQSYLAIDKPSTGSIVLYAAQDGDYEIYRDNQLIRRIPAQLGRNEIDYSQLPGGYYNVEIRLVDRLGRIVSQENQTISNIGNQTNNGWFLTMGKGPAKGKKTPRLVQFGRSRVIESVQTNITLLKDDAHHWAVEANVSRPLSLNKVNITPTGGLMSGEKRSGGYVRLNGGNNTLGYFSLARYQSPYVSRYAPDSGSTSGSYTRRIGPTQLSYQFNQYRNNRQHRIQSGWDWQLPQFNLALSLGLQNGGQWNSHNNYGVFLNTTLSFGQSNASINTAYTQQQLNTSASYQKEFIDNYGASTLGVSGSASGKLNSVGGFAKRSGSRGGISGRVGIDNQITNGGISYNGMLALSSQGVALGRSSYSGAALLIKAPALGGTPYSFHVEDSPITGGGTYAIPVPRYQDRFFVRTHTDRSDMDMNIQLPVNIVRAHPGQVFSGEADITLNLLYSGFLKNAQGLPVSGVIEETGDTAYPNGLFSINAQNRLQAITVHGPSGRYRCDMHSQPTHIYLCHAD